MDEIDIASSHLAATIALHGAELQRLTANGHEFLWDGDPAWWSGRAPILFPIVGALAKGRYRWNGRAYAMEKHGFARRRRFTLVEQSASAATLRLAADDQTRAHYPFDFALELEFSVDGDSLCVTARVRNEGAGPMPFSFGFHPAFRCPSRDGATLGFDEHEAGPMWRINRDGLLDHHDALPGDGHSIALKDQMFADDAMILRGLASRALRFTSSAQDIAVEWEGLPDLGIWTKPGAPFLCIEPWAGYSDPVGFAGSLDEKPGITLLAPSGTWSATMTITPRQHR